MTPFSIMFLPSYAFIQQNLNRFLSYWVVVVDDVFAFMEFQMLSGGFRFFRNILNIIFRIWHLFLYCFYLSCIYSTKSQQISRILGWLMMFLLSWSFKHRYHMNVDLIYIYSLKQCITYTDFCLMVASNLLEPKEPKPHTVQ